jgi:hypothetical protein
MNYLDRNDWDEQDRRGGDIVLVRGHCRDQQSLALLLVLLVVAQQSAVHLH